MEVLCVIYAPVVVKYHSSRSILSKSLGVLISMFYFDKKSVVLWKHSVVREVQHLGVCSRRTSANEERRGQTYLKYIINYMRRCLSKLNMSTWKNWRSTTVKAFRKHSRQEQRRSAIIELGPGAIPGSFHVFKDGHRSAIDQLIQNTEPNSFAAEPEPGGGNGKPDIRYCGMKFDYRKSADIRVILLIGRSHLVVPTPLPIAPLRSLKI
ncbi:unnamed protein product, partial [Nesidiocoris tenuis]